jgi:mxaJ protein
MKVGVQAVGEEYTPPGDALARRGLQDAIVPFHTTGGDENQILDAVARGEVDTAVVWGPPAGYFIKLYHPDLRLMLIVPEIDPPALPFTFSISMAVRKGNVHLRDELEGSLHRHAVEIHKILTSYGVPQLDFAGESSRARQ